MQGFCSVLCWNKVLLTYSFWMWCCCESPSLPHIVASSKLLAAPIFFTVDGGVGFPDGGSVVEQSIPSQSSQNYYFQWHSLPFLFLDGYVIKNKHVYMRRRYTWSSRRRPGSGRSDSQINSYMNMGRCLHLECLDSNWPKKAEDLSAIVSETRLGIFR